MQFRLSVCGYEFQSHSGMTYFCKMYHLNHVPYSTKNAAFHLLLLETISKFKHPVIVSIEDVFLGTVATILFGHFLMSTI